MNLLWHFLFNKTKDLFANSPRPFPCQNIDVKGGGGGGEEVLKVRGQTKKD